MPHLSATQVKSYSVAVASVAIAVLIGSVLREHFEIQSTLLLFFAAVVVSAAYGGLWPALLAIVLSYVGEHWLLLVPRREPMFDPANPAHWVRSVAFLVISSITTGLIVSIRRAQAKAVRESQALLDVIRKADLRKDTFLSTVAHELRNPLAAVSNAVELWSLVGTGSPQTDEIRDIIRRQVCHMSRLVEDLMDIPRIAHGQLEQRMRPLQLQEIIREAIEEIEPVLKGSSHTLQVSLADEPLWVYGDPDRLRQVFGNILHNAAKYTPPGGHVALSAGLEQGRVVTRVKDDGAGIPPEMLADIFVPFTQIDKSRSQSRGGIGIGLALVKQLVELHAGRVEAHSDGPGTGSEFVVRLPTYDPSYHQDASPPAGQQPPTERANDHSSVEAVAN